MAGAANVAVAASNFTVSPGNWVVTDEVNGQPGRGMGIEVRDGTLVMAVYNYTASGAATFHLTAGPMNGNAFTGQLQSYRGGRYLGGPAQDAVETGSAGAVNIRFTSATTGTIQFPGEQPVNMSRFVFDGLPQGRFLRSHTGEVWLLTRTKGTYGTPESSIIAINEADGRLWSDAGDCQMNTATAAVTCNMDWDGRSKATVTLKRYAEHVEGTMVSGYSSTPSRVVGRRMALLNFGNDKQLMFDTPTTDWAADSASTSSLPESGLWIIRSENTGRPGRGLTLDMQLDTLVVQLYGYEADGSPTFRIGSGKFRAGSAAVALQKVQGGRHYGSGALSGTTIGSDGDAQIRFTSPTTGVIQLPGEQWVEMQKFTVGAVAPQPESLLGKWMFWVAGAVGSKQYAVFDLTQVKNGKATNSSDTDQCWYENTRHGSVRCRNFWDEEFRFTPAYSDGASMAWYMETDWNDKVIENGEHGRISAQRIVDRQGVMSGVLDKP